MRKRILIATLIITLVGFAIFSVVSASLSYGSLIDNSKDIITAQIRAVDAARVGAGDKAAADALSREFGGLRVTFMTEEGVVTGDSFGVPAGEDRSGRAEVAAAMAGEEGVSTRHSDTTGEDMLYVCVDYGGGLVRLGVHTSTQWDAIVDTLPTLAWFLVLDVFVCLVFSYFATNYALRPVEELAKRSRSTSSPLSTTYRELYPITEILNRKNEEIREQMRLIDEEHKRVNRAQESKNEFISNISHEMNTPLTSIKGFAELLEHGDLDEETKKKAYRIIKTQADRLTGLIGSIINFNELDNDELPCFDCDVALAARETAESLRADIEGRGLTLTVDADEPLMVPTRPERLQEIFGNLIRNATKYNKENGSITVTVKGGKAPYAEVSDTGIGISEEDMKRVFARFFTVDRSHGGKHGGFGLGLAVVKKLCDRAGWRLTVRSTLGEGTTFRIEF